MNATVKRIFGYMAQNWANTFKQDMHGVWHEKRRTLPDASRWAPPSSSRCKTFSNALLSECWDRSCREKIGCNGVWHCDGCDVDDVRKLDNLMREFKLFKLASKFWRPWATISPLLLRRPDPGDREVDTSRESPGKAKHWDATRQTKNKGTQFQTVVKCNVRTVQYKYIISDKKTKYMCSTNSLVFELLCVFRVDQVWHPAEQMSGGWFFRNVWLAQGCDESRLRGGKPLTTAVVCGYPQFFQNLRIIKFSMKPRNCDFSA